MASQPATEISLGNASAHRIMKQTHAPKPSSPAQAIDANPTFSTVGGLSPSPLNGIQPGEASGQNEDPEAQEEQIITSQVSNRKLSRKLLYSLYLSHFLSTWNNRSFEFGSVLFLATVFPGTLLPMSVYALCRSGSAFLLSPFVGRYVDRTNRLKCVRLSIVLQRAAVVISCVIFWLMLRYGRTKGVKPAGLIILTILSILEKLFSIMNLICIERDWVVVIANQNEPLLQKLNARMRRIDLICKLIGPLAISLLDAFSTNIAVLTTLGTNFACLFAEYPAILLVYNAVPGLHSRASQSDEVSEGNARGSPFSSRLSSWKHSFQENISLYFRHAAALASISLSILYFTVLSFSGQMITYLLSIGFKSSVVGGIRTASVVFELSATVLAPLVMKRIGATRGGLWFVNWQVLSLLALSAAFLAAKTQTAAGIGLVVGVIVSRVGLWGFDLCVQVLVQQEVDEAVRGSFSSVEASLQNAFEGLSYVSTMIFARPGQFRVPVMLSVGATAVAGAIYAAFVRRRRGHLLHESKCTGGSRRW